MKAVRSDCSLPHGETSPPTAAKGLHNSARAAKLVSENGEPTKTFKKLGEIGVFGLFTVRLFVCVQSQIGGKLQTTSNVGANSFMINKHDGLVSRQTFS